jgi:hypothetical protein
VIDQEHSQFSILPSQFLSGSDTYKEMPLTKIEKGELRIENASSSSVPFFVDQI